VSSALKTAEEADDATAIRGNSDPKTVMESLPHRTVLKKNSSSL
jgi:hypothetical protein